MTVWSCDWRRQPGLQRWRSISAVSRSQTTQGQLNAFTRMRHHKWELAFFIGLLIHSCAYHYLFLGRVLTALLVGAIGVVAAVLCLGRVIRGGEARNYGALLLCSLLWVVWFTLPIERAGVWVRFTAEFSRYESAVAQLNTESGPACVKTRLCWLDSAPPFETCFRVERPHRQLVWHRLRPNTRSDTG